MRLNLRKNESISLPPAWSSTPLSCEKRPTTDGNSTKTPDYRCSDGQKIWSVWPKDNVQKIGLAAVKITGRRVGRSFNLVGPPHSDAVPRVQTIMLKHL